ncbi:MAG: HEAT repeat domain-containing protein [Planctomycetota bacterium]|jgi:HEAT repeat protein
MSIKYLYIVLLLIPLGCQQMQAAEEPSLNNQKQALAPKQLDKQLKINRDALLQGPTEQMRIDAATIILFDSSSDARQILLSTLNQTENAEAQAAVCKALKQLREENKHNSINNKEDFVVPLLAIIKDQNAGAANLAAEATVIFDYWEISQPLEQMVSDESLPVEARLNAIYALKLQKDIKAITKLINLLDETDQQIVIAAKNAVKDAGIPVLQDPAERQQLIEELNNKGKEEFLRDWLIRQEAEMNRLQTETQQWRQMYLLSLDKIYSGINEDNARVKFLSEHLNSQLPVVKLWALEQISKWRVGTSSKLPTELGPLLLNLISDEDRTVRLRTARLLSLMGQLSSAEKLLAQVKSEKDKEVRIEMFMALGAACQFAFAPDSGINISPEIREQTLEIASEYLFEARFIEVQNGAEVIKKLLMQNGLPAELTESYLIQISQKYQEETSNDGDQALRAALLSTMADLCAQGTPVATSAREKYGHWFNESLVDESDSVRDAAVSGLINIDKTSSLRRLREDHINDPSAQIRKKVIDLAREVGSETDLDWLEEKLKNSEENQLAWPAMMAIYGRSNVDLLVDWFERINKEKTSLSNQQLISFFEMAEQKLQTENMPEILREINQELAVLYTETADYELAAEYWGLLHQSAQSSEEQEKYMNKLLGVYLSSQNIKNATDLIHNYLLDKDMDPNDLMIETLDNFISEPPEGADPNKLLLELEQLDVPQVRPKWTAQKEYWSQIFKLANEPNTLEDTGS